MKILKLILENFQGIRSAEYALDGKNAQFYGENGTGKTTVFNAYTWLLFGKASDGVANFTPKPRKGDEDLHNVNTSVEMTFIHNDTEHTIARVFSEVWKKKRGTAQQEFTGHETAYFINGVPTRESDYIKFLSEIATIEQFKILTFPLFFSNELDWATRRKILFDACGNLSDTDVIASNIELIDFPKMLGNNTVDEFKKIITATMKRTNEQLNNIPERIDEAMRAIPETNSTVGEINATIADLNQKKAKLEQKRADIINGGLAGSTLRKAISEKEAEILESRSQHLRKNSETTDATYAKLAEIRNRNANAETRIISEKRVLEKLEAELQEILIKRDSIKADYAIVQNEEFDPNLTICPTCKREYTAENIEQIKNNFNTEKTKRLDNILNNGKKTAGKELVATKEQEVETAKIALDTAIKTHEITQAEVAALNDELAIKTGTLQDFEQTSECIRLKSELDSLQSQAKDDKQAQTVLVSDIDKEILIISDNIKHQYELLATYRKAMEQRIRVEELQSQEEKLGDEYVNLEHQLYLCELFIKSKVSMLDERINGKFKTVRFRLFQEQINGGLKECCDALIPTSEGNLVTWNGAANFAATVNAGLEIIATLAEYWGINIPVWFDGAESVTQFLDIPQQFITLAVREGEKILRLEKEN